MRFCQEVKAKLDELSEQMQQLQAMLAAAVPASALDKVRGVLKSS